MEEPSVPITKWQKPVWKATLCVSNSLTCGERQTVDTVKRSVLPGLGVEGRDGQAEHRGFSGP